MKKIGQLILAIFVLPAIAIAGSEKENENWSVVSLKRHQIESKFQKRDIRLKVGVRDGYDNSGKSYDVLYYHDGFTTSGLMNELVNLLSFGEEIPRLITVGIDLDVDNANEWFKERSYILTPTKSDIYQDFGIPGSWTGGGAHFLKSLEKEVIPSIEITSMVFEGESHTSVCPSAYSRGLRNLFSGELDKKGETTSE